MFRVIGWIVVVGIAFAALLFGLVCWGGGKMAAAQDDAGDGW